MIEFCLLSIDDYRVFFLASFGCEQASIGSPGELSTPVIGSPSQSLSQLVFAFVMTFHVLCCEPEFVE